MNTYTIQLVCDGPCIRKVQSLKNDEVSLEVRGVLDQQSVAATDVDLSGVGNIDNTTVLTKTSVNYKVFYLRCVILWKAVNPSAFTVAGACNYSSTANMARGPPAGRRHDRYVQKQG